MLRFLVSVVLVVLVLFGTYGQATASPGGLDSRGGAPLLDELHELWALLRPVSLPQGSLWTQRHRVPSGARALEEGFTRAPDCRGQAA